MEALSIKVDSYGGITVRIVGSLVECEVKPAAADARRG